MKKNLRTLPVDNLMNVDGHKRYPTWQEKTGIRGDEGNHTEVLINSGYEG